MLRIATCVHRISTSPRAVTKSPPYISSVRRENFWDDTGQVRIDGKIFFFVPLWYYIITG